MCKVKQIISYCNRGLYVLLIEITDRDGRMDLYTGRDTKRERDGGKGVGHEQCCNKYNITHGRREGGAQTNV